MTKSNNGFDEAAIASPPTHQSSPRSLGMGGFPRQLTSWAHQKRDDSRRMLSQLAARARNRTTTVGANNPQAAQQQQQRASWSSPPFLRRMPLGVSKRAERQIRRLGPILLLLSLVVYLLLGAAAFLFFEHTNHEQTVRKWFFNLILNRHKFARQISSAIFNGTRNMLVIVDYDSSERIQRDLVQLLSQYEQQLGLRVPDLNEWTLENSLTYCWGLLTTIGHGHRAPKTGGGQVFALLYCLLGVPFFVITLIVLADRLHDMCSAGFRVLLSSKRRTQRHHSILAKHRLLLLFLLCSLYCLWLLLFAIVLFTFAIPESFWRSLYTAVLASLTIQSADYNALAEPQKLLTLGGASVSLLLACICIFSMTGVWRQHRHGRRNNFTAEVDGNEVEKRVEPAKFQVVVDKVGTVKVLNSSTVVSAPNSPIAAENSSGSGGKLH